MEMIPTWSSKTRWNYFTGLFYAREKFADHIWLREKQAALQSANQTPSSATWTNQRKFFCHQLAA
jgi:hypothetical protein